MGSVPKIWDGTECWIIGGGTSIATQFSVPDTLIPDTKEDYLRFGDYLRPIWAKRCIGVNNSIFLGSWIDIGFFGDNSWGIENKHKIDDFGGLKVTCAPRFANKRQYPSLKFIKKNPDKRIGISLDRSALSWNYNSGCAAINLAVLLGSRRIILLGFDMSSDKDTLRPHWHSGHPDKSKTPTIQQARKGYVAPKVHMVKQPRYDRHMSGFDAIAEDAERLGIEIINASPESAVDQFPKTTVSELIGDCNADN